MYKLMLAILFGAMLAGCAQSSGGSSGPQPQNPASPNGPSVDPDEADFQKFPRTYYRPYLGIAPKITVQIGSYIDDVDIKKGVLWNSEDSDSIFGCLENKNELTFIMKKRGTPLDQNLKINVASKSGFYENTTGTMFPYRLGVKVNLSGYYDQSGETFDPSVTTSCYFEAKVRGKTWGGHLFCKDVKNAQNETTNFRLSFDCEFLKD